MSQCLSQPDRLGAVEACQKSEGLLLALAKTVYSHTNQTKHQLSSDSSAELHPGLCPVVPGTEQSSHEPSAETGDLNWQKKQRSKGRELRTN